MFTAQHGRAAYHKDSKQCGKVCDGECGLQQQAAHRAFIETFGGNTGNTGGHDVTGCASVHEAFKHQRNHDIPSRCKPVEVSVRECGNGCDIRGLTLKGE